MDFNVLLLKVITCGWNNNFWNLVISLHEEKYCRSKTKIDIKVQTESHQRIYLVSFPTDLMSISNIFVFLFCSFYGQFVLLLCPKYSF